MLNASWSATTDPLRSRSLTGVADSHTGCAPRGVDVFCVVTHLRGVTAPPNGSSSGAPGMAESATALSGGLVICLLFLSCCPGLRGLAPAPDAAVCGYEEEGRVLPAFREEAVLSERRARW